MRRLSAVLLATLLFQQPSPSPPKAAAGDPFAEYPPYETAVQMMVRSQAAMAKATAQLAQAPDSPETAEALLPLVSITPFGVEGPRATDTIRVIRAVIEQHPDAIARTFETMGRSSLFEADGVHDYRPALRELLDAARAKLPALPRAEAADLAYQLIQAETWLNRLNRGPSSSTVEPLKALAQQYAGTEGALRAELDLATASVSYRDVPARIELFETFVRGHPGTCAAARALRLEAFELGHNLPAGLDPTERFLQVFAIARGLEASTYRGCVARPEDDPVTLVTGMSAYKPAYHPGNVDRLLAAYQQFFESHFLPDVSLGSIVSRMLELYRAKGEGVAAFDRFLAEFEKTAAGPDAVRYIRALIYFSNPGGSLSQYPPETLPPDEARTRLAALSASGNGLYPRKALATLAWLYAYDGDAAKAREAYSNYAKSYPQSPYAWVAALRAGQCAAEMGDWKAATAACQLAATNYASIPMARILGHAYAARALEAANQPAQALTEYQAAADGWDRTGVPRYSFHASRKRSPATIGSMSRDDTVVTLDALTARISQLKRTLAAGGGDLLEQARWLIDHGKYKDAVQLLAGFGKRYARSPNLAEANCLAHKAQLYDALQTLNIEGEANQAAGVKALDALAAEPYDFPVCAAKIGKAVVVAQQGRQEEADKLMRAALDQWRVRQNVQQPSSALEKDIADIRNAVFLPMGGAVYGSQWWNAFSWPRTMPAFVVVNADVPVKFADASTARVSLTQRFPGLDNVLFITGEQVEFLSQMMTMLGGTKTREARVFPEKGVMEAPNQPVGPSLNIIRFVASYFEARPGHWGGWEFLTYPVINEIEFTNAERTAARARVVIGYGGCDVLLEKTAGAWKAVKITNMWVT